MRRCFYGESTADASDYVEVEVTAGRKARQFLGAHAKHLNEVMQPGFETESISWTDSERDVVASREGGGGDGGAFR
jgi:hypothetical protein